MNRLEAFTIKVKDNSSAELQVFLGSLLEEHKAETVRKTINGEGVIDTVTLQPNYKLNLVFWLDHNIPKELFGFASEFDCIHDGRTGLYCNGKPLTRDTYRTWIPDDIDGIPDIESVGGHYEYVAVADITDVAPIIEEEIEF